MPRKSTIKPVTVADLKDQTGEPGSHAILYCVNCQAEYSANKGDYFLMRSDYVFKCCRRLMRLVVKRTVYSEV